MIVYFTGTGNSRFCASFLADHLQDSCVDVFPFLWDGSGAELHSEKPWVFVSPTYSWQLPRVYLDVLRRSKLSGSRDAYFVMTCGEDIGNAAAKNRAFCQSHDFHCCGTLPVVMPENYIAMFGAPEQPEALRIIESALPILEQAAAVIREGRSFPASVPSLMDRLKSGIVNSLFYRFQVTAKPFTVSDACISCGKCERDCPLGNIRLQDGKPHWGTACTHCMACICGCPASAIEYGEKSQGKPRYQCPPYRG